MLISAQGNALPMLTSARRFNDRTLASLPGYAGIQRCGDWCRHYQALSGERWEGFARCVNPLSPRHGAVFSVEHECEVGAVTPDEGAAGKQG